MDLGFRQSGFLVMLNSPYDNVFLGYCPLIATSSQICLQLPKYPRHPSKVPTAAARSQEDRPISQGIPYIQNWQNVAKDVLSSIDEEKSSCTRNRTSELDAIKSQGQDYRNGFARPQLLIPTPKPSTAMEPDGMESPGNEAKQLEIFEVGPCADGYDMGFLIGHRFSGQIRSRLATDLILQNQLLPFAQTPQGHRLIKALSENNQKKFPNYWNELLGTAQGSGVPFLDILLLNFRKEILPFIPKSEANLSSRDDNNDDCSDMLVVSDYMAIAAHNEDANVALLGHTYLIKGVLPNGLCFTAYTYAGELPSCAFAFNSFGLAFTLNSVPPSQSEIVAGGIGRNFISRDLLEAESMDDALTRIRSSDVSVGHSYNLIDTGKRRILNVETASLTRVSILEVGETPFFHANMYLHLQVQQVQDENSLTRQKSAALLPKSSKRDFLSLLGDTSDKTYPIYMTGPVLYTLCTVLIDLDEKTLSITEGNPKQKGPSYVFSMS